MKKFKCPECKREREAEEDIVEYICPGCQVDMVEVKDGRRIKKN